MNTLNELKSGKLKGTKRIKLSCGLTSIPAEVFDLCETLEYLDLSGNKLSSLPEEFKMFQQLKIAFFSDNLFTEFPSVFSSCLNLDIIGFKANKISHIPEESFPPYLRWLILTNNRIPDLPKSIGHCVKMQKLMLAGNQLRELPGEMQLLKNLQLLRISANEIFELPDWLFSLPQLSWLAFASNPCSQVGSIETLSEISWQDLLIQDRLGEGASGVISKALWVKEDKVLRSDVAVKIFKGSITSDGLPSDEMMASLKAGTHSNLVEVLGKINFHPEGKNGLLMGLIPSEYFNLGNPPDFVSCTRDVFPTGTRFRFQQILLIVRGIASAMVQLHKNNIMHGDLYAHNILINSDSHALFGDFGAATMYHNHSENRKYNLERLEVRAFGCLLDDLLQHCEYDVQQRENLILLMNLKDQCFAHDVTIRPDFKTVLEILTSIN